MAKRNGSVIVDDTLCKGCNLCIEFCPSKALSPKNEMTKKGVFPPQVDEEKCTLCGTCTLYCPDFAIFLSTMG